MITRRHFNSAMAASLLANAAILSRSSNAQPQIAEDPLPSMPGGDGPDAGIAKYAAAFTGRLPEGDYAPAPPAGLTPEGSLRPTPEQRTLGARILAGAPHSRAPFEVAQYFRPENLRKRFAKDAGNEDPTIYARAWPEDTAAKKHAYNPVVFDFLARMDYIDKTLIEEGDKVDWCAAFVSWCIVRSQSPLGRMPRDVIDRYRHPGARSFLCFGDETKNPKPGDLVIWYDHEVKDYQCRKNGTGYPKTGKGHVAFYVGPSTALVDGKVVDAVAVLGGNQGFEGIEKNHQWVCVKNYPKEYSSKRLTSFRTAEVLHKPLPFECTPEMEKKRIC